MTNPLSHGTGVALGALSWTGRLVLCSSSSAMSSLPLSPHWAGAVIPLQEGTDPSAGGDRSQCRGHQIPVQWPHSSQPSLPPAGIQGILWPSAPPEKCHRCHSLPPESRGQAQTSAAQSGLFRGLLNSSEDFLAGSQSSGKI